MTAPDADDFPEPPAWFNLNAVFDEGSRADVRELVKEVAALTPTVRELAIRSFRVICKASTAVSKAGLDDDSYEWVYRLVRVTQLHDAWDVIDDEVCGARAAGDSS